MKKMLAAISLLAGMSCTPQPVQEIQPTIIPSPVSLKATAGKAFELNEKVVICYSDPSLQTVATRLAADIRQQTGLSLATGDKGSAVIRLELAAAVPGFDMPVQTYGLSPKDGNPADEQYALQITSRQVRIIATAPEGIYRGTSSLRQLIGNPVDGTPVLLPSMELNDAPRFAWRGLSFDVARTFFRVEEVKQVIDMLALYKMNMLHLHLTDHQAWRIEIKKYPKLTEVGGFLSGAGNYFPTTDRPGGFYTQVEFAEIVQYAADRFITVIPEIDMPGHSAAAFASYPELKKAKPIERFKNNPMVASAPAFDADDAFTMQFVEDVLTEIAAMTPGCYLHVGGDETFGMPEEKFVQFVDKVRPMVHKLNKKMVGWQETSRADIGEGDVLQLWVNPAGAMFGEDSPVAAMMGAEILDLLRTSFAETPHDAARALGKGAKLSVSVNNYLYLDAYYAEPSHDAAQEAERTRLGMPAYEPLSVERAVSWDPSTLTGINPETDITGVEGAIWCETITNFSDLQFLLLPRLPGVAEKGWAQAVTVDWNDYRQRLATQASFWRKAGWNYFQSSLVDWQ